MNKDLGGRNKVQRGPTGSERGGIKGSRKGIKHGHAGRQLNETEHDERMEHETSSNPANPNPSNGVY